MSGYNGWRNRETWLVIVWYSPDTKEDLFYAKAAIEEEYDSLPNGPLKDMIDLDAIDWKELEEHFEK